MTGEFDAGANCDDHPYATWDAAYVLGSLSRADRREFEGHLDRCSSCRSAVAELAPIPRLLSLLSRDDLAALEAGRALPARRVPAPSGNGSRPPGTGETAQPVETVMPFFRTRNYAPVPDEQTAFGLPVEGAIPPELTGWYLRNGPNPRTATGHWCIGDGMVHGIRLERGRAAWYRNRWVHTDSFERPFPVYGAGGRRNLRSSVANTHVVRHAGKTLALMETSLPYQITNDLKTLGAYDFGGKLADAMNAHPKICPDTGELHFFGYGSLVQPHVTYHRADAAGELILSRPIDVPALTLMHDFALTARHIVFLDLPVLFDLSLAVTMDARQDLPYRWDDSYGARLGVLRRDDPYGAVRWFEVDPCYVFHIANAYDVTSADGYSVVLQVIRYPELWRDDSAFDDAATLWRWTIDLADGSVEQTQLDDRGVEFPRIDDRRSGRRARYAVTVGTNTLVRYDLDNGIAEEHRFVSDGVRGTADEAIFVAADGGPDDELAGWYLSYVYDPARDASDLVIIDAADFAGDPVARIRLPRRVPHGFHGNWLRD
ncbi:retinal pigment epithelial membrane protein [Mycobacterium novum]|uniref:Dioxygenase n=1 Tax=Mycobacterium novum TaxID=2492438 RepID=A0A7I7JH08_9MYCO|nr:carotenoid oxygenase family protein [Mycobacterium novum]BBX11023.1 retinal pigment epithelial membrane protein [Mycobacterium novum]